MSIPTSAEVGMEPGHYTGSARGATAARARSRASPSGADGLQIVGRRDQQDEPAHTRALDARPLGRVLAQPAGTEPGEHAHLEAGRIAPRVRARLAGYPGQLGQVGMHRLGVEAVAEPPGDRGHARAEAAHDDGRGRVRTQEAGRTIESKSWAREAGRITAPEAA